MLVGGQGTRLRPLTLSTPKPMLPVAGVPFLTHQLARLREAGAERVVLATSYRAEVFAAHFGDGSDLGLELAYVTEAEPLGTGGGIRNAAAGLAGAPADPVVVLNGDVLSGHDLSAQLALHAEHDAHVTLHLVEVDDARPFGCVPTDPTGRVTAFVEKSPQPVTNRVNAGCYVFRRQVLERIPTGRPVSVERETFPALLAEGAPVYGYVESAYWLDVGTPAALVAASCDLVLGRARSAALPAPPGEALLLEGARVDPSASVRGGTALGPGAQVGAGAVVERSLVLAGARIGAGAVVRRSVLARDAQVAAGAVVEDAVIGERAQVGAGNELRAGARLWPDVVLADGALRFSSDV